MCEGCSQERATDWSHRIGAGVGGEWRASNGLHLSRRCHQLIHSWPALARNEWGWRLESHEDPLSMPALLAVHGWVLLDDEGGMVQISAVEASALLHPP